MTLLSRLRTLLAEALSRLRDRRRRERQRLEEIFDRQTFVSLLVLGTASKVIERLAIPLIAGEPVEWNIAAAYVFMFLFSTVVAVYWTHVSEAASDAADAVEDAVSGDGSG